MPDRARHPNSIRSVEGNSESHDAGEGKTKPKGKKKKKAKPNPKTSRLTATFVDISHDGGRYFC